MPRGGACEDGGLQGPFPSDGGQRRTGSPRYGLRLSRPGGEKVTKVRSLRGLRYDASWRSTV
jgi:hypothetical protein